MTTPTRTWLFDRWASFYDRRGLQLVAYRPVHHAVLDRVGGLDPAHVVDLGCGTGQLTRRLARRFPAATVVGVDLSPGMLAEAADRRTGDPTGRWSLVRADAERLPFAGASIDLVVCTESFHWYQHQERALEGLAHVIRPGGRLVVASIAALTRQGDATVRRLTRMGGNPIRAVPPHRLRRLLHEAGFDVVHQRRVPRPGAWPELTDARRR